MLQKEIIRMERRRYLQSIAENFLELLKDTTIYSGKNPPNLSKKNKKKYALKPTIGKLQNTKKEKDFTKQRSQWGKPDTCKNQPAGCFSSALVALAGRRTVCSMFLEITCQLAILCPANCLCKMRISERHSQTNCIWHSLLQKTEAKGNSERWF